MFRRRNSTVMAAPRGNLDTWANGTWLNDWMVVNPSPSRRHTSRRLTPYGPVGRSINRGESIRTRTRHDQPSVRIGATADSSRALAAASSAEAQRAAIEELQRGIYAATSQAPQAALLRTWERFHNAWFCGCLDVYPLQPNSVRAIAAMFRAGNYSSFKNYAFAAKSQHVRLGFPWSQQLDKHLKDCIRSVNRGLGVSNRSEPIDLVKSVDATWGWPQNMVDLNLPIDTTALILVACTFMCREIEVAGALEFEFTVHEDGDACSFRLPATKKDQEARGVTRTVECWCDLDLPCVSHYMLHYLGRLRNFGQQIGVDNDAMPLFPNPRGEALTKTQVNALIRLVVKQYDATINEEALTRYTAHTFRITGARWYARMGIDCTTISLHGRWSSSAVLSYLAEDPLCSLKAKMKPAKLLSDATDREVRRNEECHEVKNRLRASEDAVVPPPTHDDGNESGAIGFVLNMMSSMVHIQKTTDEQTHNWITRCGWKWAGKSHVHSADQEPHTLGTVWKKCPKCYRVKAVTDAEDSSTSSSSSDSSS